MEGIRFLTGFIWINMGNEIPCEVRLTRFPPYDRQLVRASVIDRSEQKRMEIALLQSEERLKLALKATGLGYFDWYPESRILHWDEQMHKMFDLPLGFSTGQNVIISKDIMHPDDRKANRNKL